MPRRQPPSDQPRKVFFGRQATDIANKGPEWYRPKIYWVLGIGFVIAALAALSQLWTHPHQAHQPQQRPSNSRSDGAPRSLEDVVHELVAARQGTGHSRESAAADISPLGARIGSRSLALSSLVVSV